MFLTGHWCPLHVPYWVEMSLTCLLLDRDVPYIPPTRQRCPLYFPYCMASLDVLYMFLSGQRFPNMPLTRQTCPLHSPCWEEMRKCQQIAVQSIFFFQDILAVGYGEFEFSNQTGGVACCWSLKNPEVTVFDGGFKLWQIIFNKVNHHQNIAFWFTGTVFLSKKLKTWWTLISACEMENITLLLMFTIKTWT